MAEKVWGRLKCLFGYHHWVTYDDFDSVFGWDCVTFCFYCKKEKKEGEDA